MPVKRRTDKSRRLDDAKLYELKYGPGSFLLNGLGYMAEETAPVWGNVPPDRQAEILTAMEEDWQRYRHQVLDSWANREEHELWCANRHDGNPAEPWAKRKFETAGG